MGGHKTTRVSKRAALLCVLLVFFLCLPLLSAGTPVEGNPPVQILALRSPTILVNQTGPRVDHSRQRTAVDSPFLLVPLHRPVPGSGGSARSAEDLLPLSCCAAGVHTGRSPPAAIS